MSCGCHSFEVSYGSVGLDDTLLFLHGMVDSEQRGVMRCVWCSGLLEMWAG